MVNRRNFLKKTLAVTAVSLFPVPAILQARGVNDTIRLGVIGTGSKVKIGGMGRNDMKHCRKIKGVHIAALCDVDSVNLGYAVAECAQRRITGMR